MMLSRIGSTDWVGAGSAPSRPYPPSHFSVCVRACVHACVRAFLSVCLCLSLCVSLSPFSLSACLCLSLSLCLCLSVCLSVYRSLSVPLPPLSFSLPLSRITVHILSPTLWDSDLREINTIDEFVVYVSAGASFAHITETFALQGLRAKLSLPAEGKLARTRTIAYTFIFLNGIWALTLWSAPDNYARLALAGSSFINAATFCNAMQYFLMAFSSTRPLFSFVVIMMW